MFQWAEVSFTWAEVSINYRYRNSTISPPVIINIVGNTETILLHFGMTNIGMLLLRSKSDKWVTDLSSCLKKRFRGKYFSLYFKSFIKRHLQEDGQPISHFLLVECLTWFVFYVQNYSIASVRAFQCSNFHCLRVLLYL